jgi:hypothetical protein
MAALPWFSLTFSLVAIVVSTVIAARRGWRLWRTFNGFSSVASELAGATAARAAALEPRAAALEANTERLELARTRLQRSLAELAVLSEAASEVKAVVRMARGTVPRK